MKKKTTNDDILKAINDFANETPSREEMNAKIDEVNNKIERNLTNEIESLKLKQDNAAYRFELNDLEKRVEKIETKI